jgi:hypothetical protein
MERNRDGVLSYTDVGGVRRESVISLLDREGFLTCQVLRGSPLADTPVGEAVHDAELAFVDGPAGRRVTKWVSLMVAANTATRDGGRILALRAL